MEISILQSERLKYVPKLPVILRNGPNVLAVAGPATESAADHEAVKALFPATYGMPVLSFSSNPAIKSNARHVAVILSGGQAPGGHNVIAGLFDALKELHAESKLYGFLGGPGGLTDNKYIEITAAYLEAFRNTGGFDIIGSGRTKLETPVQFEKTKENLEALKISALVIIGGDDSNTNAGVLAEYFAANNVPIQVIGVPKTIDGDMKNVMIETSFGFDTATKVYSELIGNIQRDANSAKKYWHFIKLMGRSASHIALECALQTHANITLISEEVEEKKQSLDQIITYMTNIIVRRADKGDNFGVALIPEGLIEFIPEMKLLISELNDLLAHYQEEYDTLKSASEKTEFIERHLTKASAALFASLPIEIARQLALDRDPHGNVQVSRIDTEKLLAQMTENKLKLFKKEGSYKGKFSVQTHFFGYEGRCSTPSNFDADYTYSLGYNAVALIVNGKTGYLSSIRNLTKPADEWIAGGVPITMLLNIERRHGENKAVIQKALVTLNGAPFKTFSKSRDAWALDTNYLYPGPIQYFGPAVVCDQPTKTIRLEKQQS